MSFPNSFILYNSVSGIGKITKAFLLYMETMLLGKDGQSKSVRPSVRERTGWPASQQELSGQAIRSCELFRSLAGLAFMNSELRTVS